MNEGMGDGMSEDTNEDTNELRTLKVELVDGDGFIVCGPDLRVHFDHKGTVLKVVSDEGVVVVAVPTNRLRYVMVQKNEE
jgi:hypothetical protein